jgi:hypothetical protein
VFGIYRADWSVCRQAEQFGDMAMGRPSRHGLAGGVVAVVGVAAAVLVITRPDRLSLGGALCAAAAAIVAVLPTVHGLIAGRGGRLPILPVAALFYIPFFILPALLLNVIWPDATPIQIYGDAPVLAGMDASTTGIMLAGVVSLVLGMSASRLWPAAKAVRLPTVSPRHLAMAGYGLMALHAAFWLYPPLAGIPSLGQLSRPTGLLAGAVTLGAMMTGGYRRPEIAFILLVLLPARLAAGLLTGSLNNTLIFVAALTLTMAALRPRSLIPMAGVVLVGACLYTPVQIFRTVTWTADHERITLGEKLDRVVAYVKLQIREKDGLWGGKTWATHPYHSPVAVLAWPLLKRLDQATVLATVVTLTPAEVPPWRGHSLVNLATGSIPRALWAAKPEERFGNEFGRRYRLLPEGDRQMSVNLPWLTEFYVSFLMPGVVVGMFLTGLGLGLLDRLLNRPDAAPAEIALAVTLLAPLLVPESNLSLMAGNLPVVAIVLGLVLRAMLGRSAASFIDKTGKIQ